MCTISLSGNHCALDSIFSLIILYRFIGFAGQRNRNNYTNLFMLMVTAAAEQYGWILRAQKIDGCYCCCIMTPWLWILDNVVRTWKEQTESFGPRSLIMSLFCPRGGVLLLLFLAIATYINHRLEGKKCALRHDFCNNLGNSILQTERAESNFCVQIASNLLTVASQRKQTIFVSWQSKRNESSWLHTWWKLICAHSGVK